MNINPKKTIVTFLLITLGLSAIFYWAIASAHTLQAWNGMAVLGLAWSPGVAGMFTRLLYQKDMRGMGWGWGKTGYQAVAYLIPPAYLLIVYGAAWLSGAGGVPSSQYMDRIAALLKITGVSPALLLTLYIAILSSVGVFWSCISTAGEEIGWRGLLVPELIKIMPYTRASLVSGVVWAVWHYPLIFLADYNAGTPVWYGTLCFTFMVVGTSFGYAWLRLRSGSVWTAIIFHASHNLFIQGIFDPLTIDNGNVRYFITEFGAGAALAGVLVGVLFWSRRRSIEPEPTLINR